MFRSHVLLCRKTLTKCINRRILIFKHVHHIAHDDINFFHERRICRNLSLICFCIFCQVCQSPLTCFILQHLYLFCSLISISLRFCLRAFCGLRLCRSCLSSSCTYIRFHALHTHSSFGNRSGLVQTERIDSCKCLDAVKLLYKRLFVCKYKCTEGQRNTCQKDKSLRNHSQDSGYHAHYGISECIAYDIILLIK